MLEHLPTACLAPTQLLRELDRLLIRVEKGQLFFGAIFSHHRLLVLLVVWLMIDDGHHEVAWLHALMHLFRRDVGSSCELTERISVSDAVSVDECPAPYKVHRPLALHKVS